MKEAFKNTFILALVVMIAILFVNNQELREIKSKQDEIIALQSEYQFELETQAKLLNNQIEDEQTVSNILYDICELHGLLQEVE